MRLFAPLQRLRAKLHATSGDTLIEVLAALLLATLATVMLATMIAVSTNVTSQSETMLHELYQSQSAMAQGTASRTEGTVSIAGGPLGFPGFANAQVDLYQQDGFTSYRAKDQG